MIVEILSSVIIALIGFIIILFAKTPALVFLIGKTILVRQNADRTIEFLIGKKYGNLIETKEGYYIIEPHHTLIEEKSRKPLVLVYSRYATPLSLEQGKLAEELEKLGIKSYESLLALKDAGVKEIKIAGESVELSRIIDLFNNTERADYIKGEIENRVASIVIQKIGGFGIDLFKLGVLIFLIMLGIGIGYYLISSGGLGLFGKTAEAIIQPPQITPPQETNATAPIIIK